MRTGEGRSSSLTSGPPIRRYLSCVNSVGMSLPPVPVLFILNCQHTGRGPSRIPAEPSSAQVPLPYSEDHSFADAAELACSGLKLTVWSSRMTLKVYLLLIMYMCLCVDLCT